MRKWILILLVLPVIGLSQNWRIFDTGELCGEEKSFRQIKFNPYDSSMWVYESKEYLHFRNDGTTEFARWEDFDGGEVLEFTYGIEFIGDSLFGLDRWEGLFKVVDGSLEIVNSIPNRGLYISKGENDTLYLCTDDGYNKGYFTYKGGYLADTSTANSDLNGNNVGQVLKDGLNRTWVSHWVWYDQLGSGVSMYNGEEWDWDFIHNSELPHHRVTKILEREDGTIVGMTYAGLVVYDEDADDWIVYDMSNTNMPSEIITNGLIDSEDRIWALFDEVGIGYTTNYEDWTIFDDSNSPFQGEGLKYNVLEVDAYDNIWCFDHPNVYVLSLDEFEGWLSTDEYEQSSSTLYPNPIKDQFTITSDKRITGVEIVDLTGKIVYSRKANDFAVTYNVSNLGSGIYIVNIESENGLESHRIVIE